MQACTYSHHYATPSLTTQPVPVPNTAAGQVLVKVYAAAINPIDHVTHKGTHYFLFNFKWPRTFGFDFAGVVEKEMTIILLKPEIEFLVKLLDCHIEERELLLTI